MYAQRLARLCGMSQSMENRVLVPQGFAVRSQLTTRLSDADGLLLLGALVEGLEAVLGRVAAHWTRHGRLQGGGLLCSALLWGRWVLWGCLEMLCCNSFVLLVTWASSSIHTHCLLMIKYHLCCTCRSHCEVPIPVCARI